MGLSIDDEIYRANPNVMAVLYARTPEIVTFTRDVPLRPVVNGAAFIGNGLPVFNISTLGRAQPVLSNPALGKGVAAALGTAPGVLLTGHGFVMTGRSIYNVVATSYQLRQNARIQQMAHALRGSVRYLNEMPVTAVAAAGRGEGGAGAAGAQGGRGGRGGGQQLGPPEGRDWVYWAQTIPVR
jgi:ribulose-5-phosphate 4-epimerase/fuculose-1-phosphate aldolase